MRIGILTFSAAFNFGAVLQCYALYSTLQDMGHQVKVIDYKPTYLAAYKPVWGIRDWLNPHISTIYSRRHEYKYWRKIYDGYNKFEHNYMAMTSPCYTSTEVKEITSRFDYVIVGSDQVWNTKYNNFDTIWYGDSNSSSGTKWISYAASAGAVLEDKFSKKAFNSIISNFDSISVREADLRDTLQRMTSKRIELVLDPSLLPDLNLWEEWSAPILASRYIITYQARKSDTIFKIARHISKLLGDIKIIPIDLWDNVKTNGYETFIANPLQFISLIKNATCVITTSFHGTAFSIALGTPFYTLRLNDGADNRVENLLKGIGLSNRLISYDTLPAFENIDFTDSWKCLKTLRQSSFSYLYNSIQ